MSSDYSSETSRNNNDEKISIKKSTFNGLYIGLVVLVGVSAFFAGSYTSGLNSDQISAKDLDDAMAKLELKLLQNQLPARQAGPAAAAAAGIVEAEPVRVSIDDDPIFGNPDAPITIVEFSDFQCPFCARFHIQTLPSIFEEYIDQGKVKLVFRDFPLSSIHPNALPASMAAQCANDQNKFREMHDMLFEKQSEWSRLSADSASSVFSKYAAAIHLDQVEFDSCLTSAKYTAEIQNDLNDGREYGVTGTPGFFIGNDQLGYVSLKGAQPFESFKKIIDAQLNT